MDEIENSMGIFFSSISKIKKHLLDCENIHKRLQHQIKNLKDENLSLETHLSYERKRLSDIEKRNASDKASGSFHDLRNPTKFYDAFNLAKNAIRTYCAKLTREKKSQENFKYLTSVFEENAQASEKHSLQEFVSRIFFSDFENSSFSCEGKSYLADNREEMMLNSYENFSSLDTQNACESNSGFLDFCNLKFGMIKHILMNKNPEMPSKIADNMLIGSETLKDYFLFAAKEVWSLHYLAFSFYPPVEIVRIPRGQAIKVNFCDILNPENEANSNQNGVEKNQHDDTNVPKNDLVADNSMKNTEENANEIANPSVVKAEIIPFMIYPGFRIDRNFVVKPSVWKMNF